MHRKFIGKIRSIVAIALASVMFFGNMTVHAEELEQTNLITAAEEENVEAVVTEPVLEGGQGVKLIADANAENTNAFHVLEMVVKTWEDNFDWLKVHYDANGEILAYESTIKIKDSVIQETPDVKSSITGNAPRIYIPIPEGWNKEKVGVFYHDPEQYGYAVKKAEVSEDGKYAIAYLKESTNEISKDSMVTAKAGIFEIVDSTVAKAWDTVAFNYIEVMRFVNWESGSTFEQHYFEQTATPNDVAYMTNRMENEKYVENYRVGETYKLEIPYDVLAKDATKYYKNIPDLKKTNMTSMYYDADKNAFVMPEGGIGDAPPCVTVKKVDELGNDTYAIRFEFKDNIETPMYESEATLVVEDNGQGNWRYLSFLKGYPEIAPIEPEIPVPPVTPNPDQSDDSVVEPEIGTRLPQTMVEQVVSEIERAEEGSEVVVKMQDATVVPAEILKAVKGKDVDISLDMGTYSWKLNGKNVTAETLQDVNMRVRINVYPIPESTVDKIANGNPAIQMSLEHTGEFGFQADLKINVGTKYKGMIAKLYYFNEEGKLEYVQSDEVEADGTVIFTFKHASDYAIILSKKETVSNEKAEVENTSPKTGDATSPAMYAFLLILAGGWVALEVRRKCNK